MNNTISVIMPVYGVEKYLHNSVSDVLNQTFRDFELILVDDNSPDNCPSLCDDFAKADCRIKVVHLKENGGVSNARNVGLSVATGEYILFLDSDDRFSPNLLELCINSVKQNPCDVVIFGLCEEYFDKGFNLYKTKTIKLPQKILKNKEDVRKEVINLERTGVYGYPWNKLFSAQLLKKSGALFPKMAFNEDIIFNADVFECVSSCNILSATPYRYAKRTSSTTGKFIPTYYEDIMLKIKRLYEQFSSWEMDEDAFLLLAQRYVRYFFSALERNFDKRAGLSAKKRREFFEAGLKGELYNNLRPLMCGGGLSGIMAKALRSGNATLCLLIAKIIYTVKKISPKIFEKLS